VRLVEFGGPEVMELVEEPTPVPAPGDVVIEVEAVGVNFADTMVRRGEYRRRQSLDFTPGFEVAGRISASEHRGPFAPGTPVVALTDDGGGYADRVLVPRERVFALPDGVDSVTAAAVFVQGVTAAFALERYGRTKPGETVLVHAAAGGVGGIAVQLAKLAGAHVIATASTPAKLAIAAGHGADEVVLGVPDSLAGELLDRTSGRGCDVVVDGVGGPLFEPSMKALADRGRYVVAGSASQEPAMIDVRRLMPRAQTVSGFIVAQVAKEDAAEPSRTLNRLCEMVGDGRLRLDLHVLDLADAAEAHRRIETRAQTGKLVLRTDRAPS
jgi:NADPH2:quinone reductase